MASVVDPTGPRATHCEPPEPECRFDLVNGWYHHPELGAIILCELHGLFAPSEVYEIDASGRPRVVDGDELLRRRALP